MGSKGIRFGSTEDAPWATEVSHSPTHPAVVPLTGGELAEARVVARKMEAALESLQERYSGSVQRLRVSSPSSESSSLSTEVSTMLSEV